MEELTLKDEQSQLDAAVKLAAIMHSGQKDKAGASYLIHVMTVAVEVTRHFQNILDEGLVSIAVLHDVVEDSVVTLDVLRSMKFSDRVVTAVDCLTRRHGEDYDTYIDRLAANVDAILVKLADLKHNMDMTRLDADGITEADLKRMSKYARTHDKLVIKLASLGQDLAKER